MSLKILGNNILGKKIYEEKRGRIHIPSSSVGFKKYHGFVYVEVEAVGQDYPYEVKKGDTVLIRRHEGKKMIYERVEYYKIKERWVDGIFRDGEVIPIADRVLIKRDEAPREKGGIIIVEKAQKKPSIGTVIKIGQGRKNKKGKTIPLPVKAGDRVYHGLFASSEVVINGEEYLLLKEEDLLGIFK